MSVLLDDISIEIAVRRARMRAALPHPMAMRSEAIASLAAGAGAELVARRQRAFDILETRLIRERTVQ